MKNSQPRFDSRLCNGLGLHLKLRADFSRCVQSCLEVVSCECFLQLWVVILRISCSLTSSGGHIGLQMNLDSESIHFFPLVTCLLDRAFCCREKSN